MFDTWNFNRTNTIDYITLNINKRGRYYVLTTIYYRYHSTIIYRSVLIRINMSCETKVFWPVYIFNTRMVFRRIPRTNEHVNCYQKTDVTVFDGFRLSIRAKCSMLQLTRDKDNKQPIEFPPGKNIICSGK